MAVHRRGLLVLTCLAIIGVCVFLTIRTWRGSPDPPLAEDQSWFWDPVRERPFRASSLLNPPVKSPWGHPSPMVWFFTCTDCEERFPGLFLSFSPQAKARLDADPDGAGAALGPSHPGRLYSADGENWVQADSLEQAPEISAELAKRCPPGQYLGSCR